MRIVNMQDVKNRKRNMSQSVYKESHIGLTSNVVSTNFNRLIDIGYSKMIAENVIQQIPKYDNSDFAFRQILEVFEMICENENASYITKIGNMIAEATVPKTRTGDQTKDYLKMKVARFKTKLHTRFDTNINNTKSAADDAIKAMQNNLTTNISKVKDNVNKSIKKENTAVDEAILSSYEKIYEAYNRAIDCDRILENQNKINKYYNMAEAVNTYYDDPQQAIIEMCSMIDSFNMNTIIKYNVSLENTMYTFAECNIQIDPQVIIETVTDYYLIHINPLNDKIKQSMGKIIECSSLFNDTTKSDYSNLFKDIAKLDIKFDDMFILLQEKPDISNYITETELMDKMLKESVSNENKVKILFDKFKLEPQKTPDKLKSLIYKMYVQSPEDIISGAPAVLSWIRRFFVIGGGIAIHPIVGIVALMTDEFIKIKLSRKEFTKYIDKYKNELDSTKKAIDKCKDQNDRSRLEEYKKELDKSIEKLKEQESKLYTDDENNNRSSDDTDEDDLFADFSFDEAFANAVVSITSLAEMVSKNTTYNLSNFLIENIEKIDADSIQYITEYIKLYPECINDPSSTAAVYSFWLEQTMKEYSESSSNKRIAVRGLIDALKEEDQIDMIDKYAYHAAFRLANMIEGYDCITEYMNCFSLNEMDFSNTMKLVSERLKSTVKSLSDKEKQMSRNIDIACSQVSKSAEKALMNENREAVIKGSLIPSASKVIKNAIITGAAWAVNPAIAVIGVIGSIAVSKKLQSKERQLILDDIEIELNMCDRYLKIAEDNNDMKAQRSLLMTKRSLERQRQRIKYKMAVYYNQKTDIKKNDNDYDD